VTQEPMELTPDLVDAVERVSALFKIPGEIVDNFKSCDEFEENAKTGLEGTSSTRCYYSQYEWIECIWRPKRI